MCTVKEFSNNLNAFEAKVLAIAYQGDNSEEFELIKSELLSMKNFFASHVVGDSILFYVSDTLILQTQYDVMTKLRKCVPQDSDICSLLEYSKDLLVQGIPPIKLDWKLDIVIPTKTRNNLNKIVTEKVAKIACELIKHAGEFRHKSSVAAVGHEQQQNIDDASMSENLAKLSETVEVKSAAKFFANYELLINNLKDLNLELCQYKTALSSSKNSSLSQNRTELSHKIDALAAQAFNQFSELETLRNEVADFNIQVQKNIKGIKTEITQFNAVQQQLVLFQQRIIESKNNTVVVPEFTDELIQLLEIPKPLQEEWATKREEQSILIEGSGIAMSDWIAWGKNKALDIVSAVAPTQAVTYLQPEYFIIQELLIITQEKLTQLETKSFELNTQLVQEKSHSEELVTLEVGIAELRDTVLSTSKDTYTHLEDNYHLKIVDTAHATLLASIKKLEKPLSKLISFISGRMSKHAEFLKTLHEISTELGQLKDDSHLYTNTVSANIIQTKFSLFRGKVGSLNHNLPAFDEITETVKQSFSYAAPAA